MKKGLITYSIISVMTALTVLSCTDDSEQYADGDHSGVFRLSSSQEVFTRAEGDSYFQAGTAYQLYAIEGQDFSANYLKDPASPGAVTGTEAGDHQSIQGISVNKFNKRTLSFYGVTNSTGTPVTVEPGENSPTCAISYDADGNPLTDIMWAKKENQTYLNSGTIELPFQHTLAKLNLYVLKGTDIEKETKVTLNKISLVDYPRGTLSMLTGEYLVEGLKRGYNVTVLKDSEQEVGTTATEVKDGETSVAPMVFPTRSAKPTQDDIENHALTIKVSATIGTEKIMEQETQITTLLAEDPSAPKAPFNFKPGYQYDVVITITKSSLVITIVPRLYDWIPEEEVKPEHQVNGSMTIGGITWMDRNLGATSGDPLAGDQAWEDSRGFYYQFGRNIPYYVKTKTKDEIIYAPANGNWHLEESLPYPFIPNHMNEEPSNWESYAFAPTDTKGSFRFASNQDWNSSESKTIWNDVKKQPCPKGWRIPTKDEFLLIAPNGKDAGDLAFRIHTNNTYIENTNDDPEEDSKSVYVGVKANVWPSTTVGTSNSIYALKRIGTDNAYYLRWHIERSGNKDIPNQNAGDGSPHRNVLVISRYPATAESSLDINTVQSAAKWENPVEQIKLPFVGYIHHGYEYGHEAGGTSRPGLIYSGSEAIYWTSTANGNNVYTFRMKFAGNALSNQIKVSSDDDKRSAGYGCLIRCVRDTKAN